MNKHADEFKKQNTEIIAIFREEKKGEAGLKIIAKNTKVKFTIAGDLGTKKTKKYSPGKREFDNYVIDRNGVIREIIAGSLMKRAKSKQLIETLKKINAGQEKKE